MREIDRTIERVKPEFSKEGFKFPYMFRFNQNGTRYYFTAGNDINDIKFYPSVTSIIKASQPTSYGLLKLMVEKGWEGYSQFMREKALYGTLLHIFISEYLQFQIFDFDSIKNRVVDYVVEHHIEFDTAFWDINLQKDLAALIQFIYDYDVKPLAIEVVGLYDNGIARYSGAIDLICEMTIKVKGFYGEVYKSGINKGEPKETVKEERITAIVDFKSGKNGFYADMELQLHMYKRMAEFSMGLNIDKCYNVSPKDWDNYPSYHIKDQTDSNANLKIDSILQTYFVDYEDPRDIPVFTGKVNGKDSMKEAFKLVSAKEYCYNLLKVQQFVKN